MAGITRINITDDVKGRGAYRFMEARKMQPIANKLYHQIWETRGLLLPGDEQLDCTKNEFYAGYDHALGIDVMLTFANGMTATLQEKFLTTTFYTLTVEYMQDWRDAIPGDWFNMKCQYYFVGYYNKKDRDAGFTRWVMVNWPSLQVRSDVVWNERQNTKDGARASFRYIGFNDIPKDCVVAADGC